MKTGYFLVDAEQPSLNADYSSPVYFGIDRSPWRGVDEKYYAGELSNEMKALRKKSFSNHVLGLSFGTLSSIDEVKLLAGTCDKNTSMNSQILKIKFLGSIAETAIFFNDESQGVGFDVYADGYGSLISLGLVEHPEFFRIFHEKLNKFGLFQSLMDIQQYVTYYKEVMYAENLEIIDDFSTLFIYRIVKIYDLML